MRKPLPSRRDTLVGAGAVAAACFAAPLRAAAPEASPITPELVAAATKEGKISFYTAMDIPVAERLAKAFEAKFPGIAVRVERSGSERLYQRIEQERGSNIHAADIVNSADAAHFIVWKRNDWLAPYLPEEVAKHFPPTPAMRTGCSSRRACGCPRSGTIRTWSRPSMRRKALPICSIRCGPARS